MSIPGLRGSVSRKTAPSPTWPHACSQPEWRWASSTEIDRPSPVPPRVRALEGSALQKRSKTRSEEHTSELQSRGHLVCRLLLEKKKQELSRTYNQTIRAHAPHAQ